MDERGGILMSGLGIRRGEQPQVGVLSDRRLYLSADKEVVVEEGDRRAAFLFATPGYEVLAGDVERYGLAVDDGRIVLPGAPTTREPEEVAEVEVEAAKDPPLPDDLPAREELLATGITTLDEVASHPDLTQVDGIGRATAAKIADYLAGADGGP